MTLILEIDPDLEQALRTTAERRGLAPDRYVIDLLKEQIARDRDLPPHLSRSETELLQRINEGLPPATWERYRALKGKRDARTLTPDEHAELLALTDQVELWNARRLELVAALAGLRQVPLRTMMAELGLIPPPYV